MIAIDRRARRVHDAADLRVARRDEDVQERVDVVLVRRDRILDRARHGAERGFVEDDVDVLARFLRDARIAQVALDELELEALVRVDRQDVLDVLLLARDEVVDADDGLLILSSRVCNCSMFGAAAWWNTGVSPPVVW